MPKRRVTADEALLIRQADDVELVGQFVQYHDGPPTIDGKIQLSRGARLCFGEHCMATGVLVPGGPGGPPTLRVTSLVPFDPTEIWFEGTWVTVTYVENTRLVGLDPVAGKAFFAPYETSGVQVAALALVSATARPLEYDGLAALVLRMLPRPGHPDLIELAPMTNDDAQAIVALFAARLRLPKTATLRTAEELEACHAGDIVIVEGTYRQTHPEMSNFEGVVIEVPRGVRNGSRLRVVGFYWPGVDLSKPGAALAAGYNGPTIQVTSLEVLSGEQKLRRT